MTLVVAKEPIVVVNPLPRMYPPPHVDVGALTMTPLEFFAAAAGD